MAEASSGNTGHILSAFYYTAGRAPLEYQMVREAQSLNKDWLDFQVNLPRKMNGCLFLAKSDQDRIEMEKMAAIAASNNETVTLMTDLSEIQASAQVQQSYYIFVHTYTKRR